MASIGRQPRRSNERGGPHDMDQGSLAMFFLLRCAFWVSALLLVLPIGAHMADDGPNAKDRASIDTMSALAAAGATIADMGGFCSRQPEACAVGGEALKLVGERARTGAAALQTYLGQETGAPQPAAVRDVGPATVGSTDAGRQTLTASDRKPVWRAPS